MAKSEKEKRFEAERSFHEELYKKKIKEQGLKNKIKFLYFVIFVLLFLLLTSDSFLGIFWEPTFRLNSLKNS